jgi:hypothetical protein
LNDSAVLAIRGLFLGFFCVWLLFSVRTQFSLVRAIAQRRLYHFPQWDTLRLIPSWGFYSLPPTRDSVLLYRDKLSDGRLTSWKSAWAMSGNPLRGIWSPQVRKHRAINSWLPLLRLVAEGKMQPAECFLSRAYVSAAIYVSGLQPRDSIDFRQFMVAEVSGFHRQEPVEILFVSPLFRLDNAL